jgi:hypothetical protein
MTRGEVGTAELGIYEGYDPAAKLGEERLEPRPLGDIEAEFGPYRPVLPPADTEVDELRAAFELAGRKAIGSIASALDEVHNEARNRFGPWDADTQATAAYAKRTLTAGRPGSWEAAAIMEVVYFGNALNLYHRKGAASVAEMRSKGPNLRRVHVEARDRIVAVLRAWTSSEDRYTEVPETLAALVSRFADETHGPDGWRAIADQWIQPSSLDKENFNGTYRLLYSMSEFFDPSIV